MTTPQTGLRRVVGRPTTGTWVLLALVALVAVLVLGRWWGMSVESRALRPTAVSGTVTSMYDDGSGGCVALAGAGPGDDWCGPLNPPQGVSIKVGDTLGGFILKSVTDDGQDVDAILVTGVSGS